MCIYRHSNRIQTHHMDVGQIYDVLFASPQSAQNNTKHECELEVRLKKRVGGCAHAGLKRQASRADAMAF